MSDAPHTPAAFINAIAEEGSKKEAVEWLQKTWNERCQLERENEALRRESARADSYWENEAKRYAGNADYWRERADAAEAKLAAIEKMGREPSEGMLSVPPHFKYVRAFTAMFAKMMEELK